MVKTILKEKSEKGDLLYRMEFFCDNEEDVSRLPTQTNSADIEKCSTGSIALVLNPLEGKSSLRILDSRGIWQEVGA